jgi:hypothetical protein
LERCGACAGWLQLLVDKSCLADSIYLDECSCLLIAKSPFRAVHGLCRAGRAVCVLHADVCAIQRCADLTCLTRFAVPVAGCNRGRWGGQAAHRPCTAREGIHQVRPPA